MINESAKKGKENIGTHIPVPSTLPGMKIPFGSFHTKCASNGGRGGARGNPKTLNPNPKWATETPSTALGEIGRSSLAEISRTCPKPCMHWEMCVNTSNTYDTVNGARIQWRQN